MNYIIFYLMAQIGILNSEMKIFLSNRTKKRNSLESKRQRVQWIICNYTFLLHKTIPQSLFNCQLGFVLWAKGWQLPNCMPLTVYFSIVKWWDLIIITFHQMMRSAFLNDLWLISHIFARDTVVLTLKLLNLYLTCKVITNQQRCHAHQCKILKRVIYFYRAGYT